MSKFATQGQRSAFWMAMLAAVVSLSIGLGGCGNKEEAAPTGAAPAGKNSQDNAEYNKMKQQQGKR